MTDSDKRSFPEPLLFGTFYPKEYLLAIANDRAQADRAMAAVQQAGFPEAEVFTGQEVLAHHQGLMEHRTLAQRLGSILSADEKLVQDDYLEQMQDGKLIVMVHVPDATEVERAGHALGEQGAFMLRYYGTDGVVEVSP